MVINGPCLRCTPHGDVNKENKEANRIEPRKTKRRETKKKFTGSYTEVNLINVMNTMPWGPHFDHGLGNSNSPKIHILFCKIIGSK